MFGLGDGFGEFLAADRGFTRGVRFRRMAWRTGTDEPAESRLQPRLAAPLVTTWGRCAPGIAGDL